MFDLDSANPAQVSGQQIVEADLGVRGRSLVVISGVAIPNFKIDSSDLHHNEARVRTHFPADSIESATAHVGLASVANDDTDFTFALDQTRVEMDKATGELDLFVTMAVLGEWSSLNRFSYQIVATVVRNTSEINGTITWPKQWLLPTDRLPSSVAPHLSIVASLREVRTLPHRAGDFASSEEVLTPVVPGEITKVTVTDTDVIATYRVSAPPKGQELKITVVGSGFPGVPNDSTLSFPPTKDGHDILTVLPAKPIVAVDFVGQLSRNVR